MQITAGSKDTRGECLACGDSPTPHIPTYITSSLEAWITDHAARDGSIRHRLNGLVSQAFDVFVDHALHALTRVGIFRTSNDLERACSYRSQIVWEEAIERGLEMQQLTLFGKPTELYRVKQGGVWRYFQSLPVTAKSRRAMYEWLDDKLKFKQLLQANSIPTSKAVCVTSLDQARKAFELLQKPIITKPRIGSRGRHTTTHVHTNEELTSAFETAQVLCRHVILEEHLYGPVSRATVVDGRLAGFLQLVPARVTGDGEHTIAELVEIKNKIRPDAVAPVEISDEHIEHLKRIGYSLHSVLEGGKTIDLSRHTGRFAGGSTRELLSSVHPRLRDYAERAARALSAPVVGFDIIIEDPESDPDSQRWGFLEANSLPFIDLHYLPLTGAPSPVARAVWDMWDRAIVASS